MKFFIVLLYASVLVVANLYSHEKTRSFPIETLSATEIAQSSKYKPLDSFNPGHHKTIIRLHALPQADTYIAKVKRPLIEKETLQYEYSAEMLKNNGKNLGESLPMLLLSSQGYLPGEKITLILETDKGEVVGQAVDCIPHPIIQEMRSGECVLKGELVTLFPTTYHLSLEGVQLFEVLKFSSHSSGEVIEKSLGYSNGSVIALSPGVLGKEGGFCFVTITRQTGDAFKVTLPWGGELMNHLEGKSSPVVEDFTTILVD